MSDVVAVVVIAEWLVAVVYLVRRLAPARWMRPFVFMFTRIANAFGRDAAKAVQS